MEFIANLSNAQNRRCTADRLKALELLFQKVCSKNCEISLDEFQKIIRSKNPFFVERVFKVFDEDSSGTVSKNEFIRSMRAIVGKSPDEKLKLLFQIYDLDGNGYISIDELRHVIKCCMEENGLEFSEEDLEHLTLTLFEDADDDETGELSYEKLVKLLSRKPGLLENVAVSVEQWLLPSLPTDAHVPKTTTWLRKFSISYISNNLTSCMFFMVIVAANCGLIIGRFYTYRDYSFYVRFAKSAGQCLNFTCSFVLIMMLRKSITLLRSWGLSRIIPLDLHIYYHKLTGYFIAFYALIHATMHCFHFNDLSHQTNVPLSDYLFTVRENTWPREYTPLTGWILLVVLIIMVLSSLPVIRRTGYFEAFHYTHLLYNVFYVLLIAHAPNFWYWFIVPGVVFLLEGAIRVRNSFGSHGYTYITQGVLLPSRVVHLVIKRPPNFEFRPGDWVFIQIPGIARTEWHPFTISSAPEMDDFLWVHIRAVGEWTNRVYDYFLNEEKKMSLESSRHVRTRRSSPLKGSFQFKPSIQRGKSYPPAKTSNSTEVSPTTPHSSISSEEDQFCKSYSRYIEAQIKNPVSRIISTPLQKSPPKFTRTVSSLETRSRVSFERSCSRVFVLPRPEDWDEKGHRVRRKSVFQSIREEKSADDPNDVESGVRGGELWHLLTQRSRSSEESRNDLSGRMIKLEKPLHLHLDGPYGSPTSHIFQTEHAILIATGIGVTPFASILQSIMYRYTKAKHVCPSCSHSWADPIPPNIMHLKKVDFVWINRHQKSFEWFVSLLSELEITQAMLHENDRLLDIHMYVTSALDKSDMKAIGLQLALDLMHEKGKRDLITGLKTRTQPGRPHWPSFFQDIANQNKGRVTVFFCGPPEVGRAIQQHSIPFGFEFRKEHF